MFVFPTGLFSASSGQPPSQIDPNFNSVGALLHFDGANGSTNFTDIKGKTIMRFGVAQISTTQSKFGGASAYFNGSGDYLSLGNHSDFDLSGLNAFTFQFFIRVPTTITDSPSGESSIFSRFSTGNDRYFLNVLSDRRIIFGHQLANGSVPLALISDTPVFIDRWTYVSLVKDGSNYYLYQDGQQTAITTYNSPLTSKGDFRIGAFDVNINTYSNWFIGYIDEFRFTKQARDDFNPPTVSFPNN